MYACRSRSFSDEEWDTGHKQPSRAVFILFFPYFLVMPGGASEGPAGRPTPQIVGKALQCVNLIGVWRDTSQVRQLDWLRRMVILQDATHHISSSSSTHQSLSTDVMGKNNHRTPHALLFPYVCIVCRGASVILKRSTKWSTLGTDLLGCASFAAHRVRHQ